MRVRAETLLIAVMAIFAMTGWLAVHFLDDVGSGRVVGDPEYLTIDPVPPDHPVDVSPDPLSATSWFQQMRGFCNPVDVETRMRWQPAPETDEGRMYEAACYALAGKIDNRDIQLLAVGANLPADGFLKTVVLRPDQFMRILHL